MLLSKEQVNIKNNYYTQERDPYKLLGFIPLVDDCHQYYAIELDEKLPDYYVKYYMDKNLWLDYNLSSITHVSPVYGGYNPNFISYQEYEVEKEQILKEKQLPQNKSFRYSDEYRKSIIDRMKNNIYILFFLGCDDVDVALRFANEKEAADYLLMIESFEDIMNDKNLIYLN